MTRKIVPAKEGQSASALLGAWESAVGPAIARRSLPASFRSGTLTVLTASSAWSNELSYLAPTILDSLRRVVPRSSISKLRFVVATGRTRLLLEGAKPPSKAGRDRSQLVHMPDAVTPQKNVREEVTDLSRRLAQSQAALNQWRDQAGWRHCKGCGSRFSTTTQALDLCAPCWGKRRRMQEARIELALMQTPWISLNDLRQALPEATNAMWRTARRRLVTRWQSEIESAERRLRRSLVTSQDRVTAWSYLMLLTGLPQHDIGRAAVANVLGNAWTTALFSTASACSQEAR